MSALLNISNQAGVADRIEVLSQVSLFAGIKDDPEALSALAQVMVLESYRSGHTLIEEGKVGDEFFVLCTGTVSIYKSTPEGDRYKVAILNGDTAPAFGEGGLVEKEPRSATVICDGECQCLVLTNKAFSEFTLQHPRWALPVYRSIASTLIGRVRKLNTDIMLLHKALTQEIRS